MSEALIPLTLVPIFSAAMEAVQSGDATSVQDALDHMEAEAEGEATVANELMASESGKSWSAVLADVQRAKAAFSAVPFDAERHQLAAHFRDRAAHWQREADANPRLEHYVSMCLGRVDAWNAAAAILQGAIPTLPAPTAQADQSTADQLQKAAERAVDAGHRFASAPVDKPTGDQ